jgi:outer membrane protein assembly factor BamB
MEAVMGIRVACHVAVLFFALFSITSQAEEARCRWNQFRGPRGAGIETDGKALPAELDEKSMIWKSEVPHGLSSPCIWGNRVFLTGITGTSLETICVDRTTGKILWRAEAWYEFIERVHRTNSPATPTAATDGKHVYVYLGSSGLLCYDFDGGEVWNRVLRPSPNLYGTASSLILAGGHLVFLNDNRRKSYLEAIDPATGETVWRSERPGLQYNWTTPMLRENGEVLELVINGQGMIKAYDLADGSERWDLPGLTDEPCVTPVTGDGFIFITSYNMKTNTEVIGLPAWDDLVGELDLDGDGELTLKESKPKKSILSRADADGEGDHPLWGFHSFLDEDGNGKITGTEWQKIVRWVDSFPQENALLAVRPPAEADGVAEIVWKYNRGVPECPSPLYFDHRVYMVKNGGMVTCLDSRTGREIYQTKLGSGGPYYASPVVGDGKIYVASARGTVTVFKAGDKLEILARNEFKERISATPALVDGKVYVRTNRHLYAFGRSPAGQ